MVVAISRPFRYGKNRQGTVQDQLTSLEASVYNFVDLSMQENLGFAMLVEMSWCLDSELRMSEWPLCVQCGLAPWPDRRTLYAPLLVLGRRCQDESDITQAVATRNHSSHPDIFTTNLHLTTATLPLLPLLKITWDLNRTSSQRPRPAFFLISPKMPHPAPP